MAELTLRDMLHGGIDGAHRGEVIHSGHFMISSVADQDHIDDEVLHDRDSPVHHDQAIRLREGYDFSEVRKETQNTYQFGHRSTNQITIDASLSRLFECMSLAYRGGKVVSPKWKNFKGMKLSVKDKIRLNNAIWRTWHIQYVMRRRRSKVSFVQFATPLDSESDCDSHSKPEAVVMEGKYWKRRIETVVAEYKKWRAFFMDKLQNSDHPGLMWVSQHSPATPEVIQDTMMRGDDSLLMDFTDRLFSCLSQPFQFPNPREIAQHATNSDMMQPGLLQLQPMIEEFMDPLDTLHDIFSPNRKSPSVNGANSVSLFYSGSNLQSSSQNSNFNNGIMAQPDLNATTEASLEELVQRATAEQDPTSMCVVQPELASSQPVSRQEMTQVLQQPNLNFGVSDPMLTSVNGKTYGQVQASSIPSSVSMMRSKQQQDTPTISQVVTAHTHHHHGTAYNQNDVRTTMPPPQKKAPRRKSMNKVSSDPGPPVATIPSDVTMSIQPVMVSQHQTPNNRVPELGILNYSTVQQMTQVPQQLIQGQGHLSPTLATSLPQVVLSPVGNYTISQQATLIPVDKLIYSQPLNSRNIQTGAQDIIIDSVNANAQLNNLNNRRKEVQALVIPVSLQQPQTNQVLGAFEQRQLGKPNSMEGGQTPNIQVMIKRSPANTTKQQGAGQQQTLLTQLLTQVRTDPNKAPNTALQVPPNKVYTTNKEQLRKVQEQAANFNQFQNSVLMAAAQMAVTPQSQVPLPMQQSSVPQPQPPVVAQPQPFVTPLNTVSNNSTEAQVMTITSPHTTKAQKPFVSPLGSPVNRSAEKSKSAQMPMPWPSSQNVIPSSMETDEDTSTLPEAKGYISALEKTTYSATSPASSSPSSAGEQRSHHFTAEQKRRCNIKSLCDRLQEILPDVNNHPNSKVSKAVLLNKTCNYVKQLQVVRQQTSSEIQQLKKRIEGLNEDISNFQQQLPATGAPVCRQRGDRMRQVFEEWVRDRTLHDWKFFIFSMIIQPWFLTYDQSVSVASLEELCKTCLIWLEKHCSMPSLRRSVVNSLQELSTTTSILSDPATLQQQAENAVIQSSRHSSGSST